MINIGVLIESENGESRVALNDFAVSSLVATGYHVFVAKNAGLKSSISDDSYQRAGAIIVLDNKTVIKKCSFLIKIQPISNKDLKYVNSNHILFCFLNLINNPQKAIDLAKTGLTAVGYETIFDGDSYPILASMSKLVGKIAYSIGANLLASNNGKGVLLGGSAGASRSKVVIFGGGNAGKEMMKMAVSSGSRVTVFDKNLEILNKITDENSQIQTMYPYKDLIIKEIKNADLILCATFAGKRNVKKLLTSEMVLTMEPKSVIIDLTVEFGGMSASTSSERKGKNIYNKHNITHYCVPNIAATIPKTASSVISASILHYLIRYIITEHKGIHDDVIKEAIQIKDGDIASFINVDQCCDENHVSNITKLMGNDKSFDLNKMIGEKDTEDCLSFEKRIQSPAKEGITSVFSDVDFKSVGFEVIKRNTDEFD